VSTQITKPTVEIVPRPDLEGVETAITALQVHTEKLKELRVKAEATKVETAAECAQAKLLELEVRSVGKEAGLLLDPYWEVVKRASDALSNIYKGHEGEAKAIDDLLKAKVKVYEAEEKRRAQEIADRENRERIAAAQKKADDEQKERERLAKEKKDKDIKEIKAAEKRGDIGKREAVKLLKEAGAVAEAAIEEAVANAEAAVQAVKDAPVSAKPNIPAVAGVPSRTNYKAEVTSEDALLLAWANAAIAGTKGNYQLAVYLRQFIMANAQAIGAEARRVKDSKKLEDMIPGIHATEE
jgi:hypothetical protein